MKRKIIRILLIITVLIGIAGTVAYFIYEAEKPWFAFYIACGAGTLAVNLILAIFFVNKNFRDKNRS